MSALEVTIVPTTPISGQKPGTSGLRKKTTVFLQPHYLNNFVQATFDALPADKVAGSTLVVGGDGRYYCKEAAQTIIKMAAANGVARVWVATNALASTPAISALIRRREGGVAYGGFILTASHNPGGINEDFGIKYNCENGGPAPESLTGVIYTNTTTISQYKICANLPDVDLSQPNVADFGAFKVEVIDGTVEYVEMLQQVFDFGLLKALVQRPDFKLVFDGLNGVAGPYAKRVFIDLLGVSPDALKNCEPKEDFGGGHPDPNLTYAHDLVHAMGLTSDGTPLPVDAASVPDFGAACDGDADRNMIVGKQFFVTPSDSLAVICANASKCIPFFKSGLKAIARSMPTSAAADRVAEKLGIKCFETPTGWKFFGNLMDSQEVFKKEAYNPMICGEESFGTGSDHVREKDGLWAVLAFLSVLAHHNPDPTKPLVSVQDIVTEHWKVFGRNYYCRYDYEGVETEKADKLTAALTAMCGEGRPAVSLGDVPLATVDEFEYTDPVDGSVSLNQGWRFLFKDGSRFVFRLSGTGSVGATIRLYLEKYESDPARIGQTRDEALNALVKVALEVSQVQTFIGRDRPTVIT